MLAVFSASTITNNFIYIFLHLHIQLTSGRPRHSLTDSTLSLSSADISTQFWLEVPLLVIGWVCLGGFGMLETMRRWEIRRSFVAFRLGKSWKSRRESDLKSAGRVPGRQRAGICDGRPAFNIWVTEQKLQVQSQASHPEFLRSYQFKVLGSQKLPVTRLPRGLLCVVNPMVSNFQYFSRSLTTCWPGVSGQDSGQPGGRDIVWSGHWSRMQI